MGRSISVGSGFHPSALRSQAQVHPHWPEFGPFQHRFGYGFFPLTGFGGAYYGPGYAAPDFVQRYDRPAEAEPETTSAIPPPSPIPGSLRPVIAYRPGCQTQTVAVPSEGGDDRSINTVRC